MKRIMTYLLVLAFGILVGTAIDRMYIVKHIQNDIQLNLREEFRTPLNDEYTQKKIYMYKYFIREFTNKNNKTDKFDSEISE